jgi:hypothetical protein
MAGVKVTGVKEVLKELKELEDGSINELRREIRKYLADDISAAYRYVQASEYSMVFGVQNAGMFHNGRTGFSTPTIKTAVRPRSRSSIISINATGTNGKFGYDILEKAGSRTMGKTASGRALIGMLQKHFPPNKAGRFVFAAIQKRLRYISMDIKLILDRYSDKVNSRIGSGAGMGTVGRAGDLF